MNDHQMMRLAIVLHARTVLGLLEAAERVTTTPEQRQEYLALARDATIEFRNEFVAAWCAPVASP